MAPSKQVKYRLVFKLLGILLMVLSGAMVLSISWSLYCKEKDTLIPLLVSVIITLCAGFVLYYFNRHNNHKNISIKEGYLIVSLTWVSMSMLGALPFYLSGAIPAFTDALF